MSHETCRKHPTYRAIRHPNCSCEVCWCIWFITRYGGLNQAAHELFYKEGGIRECQGPHK